MNYDRIQLETKLGLNSIVAGRELAFDPPEELNEKWTAMHRLINDDLDRWQQCT